MMSFLKKLLLTTTAFTLIFTQVTRVYAHDIPGTISQNIHNTMLTTRVIPTKEYERRFGTRLDSSFLRGIYIVELSIKNNSSQSLVFSVNDTLIHKATPLFTKKALQNHLTSSLGIGVMTILCFPIGFFMAYQNIAMETLAPLIHLFGPGQEDITIKPYDEFKTMLFIEAEQEEKKGATEEETEKADPLYFDMTIQLKDASKFDLPLYKRYARTFDIRIPNTK
ncbi:MAG: hypothetical protein NTX86_02570 [Candidatus Dependentiae bacterium]|nr:hypothetical protein [Candidatus Dependentiae bacterium]